MTGIACPACRHRTIHIGPRAAHLLAREPLHCPSCGAALAIRRRDKVLTIARGVLFQIILVGGLTLALYFSSWPVLLFTAVLLLLTNLTLQFTGELILHDPRAD